MDLVATDGQSRCLRLQAEGSGSSNRRSGHARSIDKVVGNRNDWQGGYFKQPGLIRSDFSSQLSAVSVFQRSDCRLVALTPCPPLLSRSFRTGTCDFVEVNSHNRRVDRNIVAEAVGLESKNKLELSCDCYIKRSDSKEGTRIDS